MTAPTTSKTEIIAFCSGKGGTGKTLIASCLGYALRQSGHRVLMVDGDAGTDGLSLFLLGPQGMKEIDAFLPVNTFTGMLRNFAEGHRVEFQPRTVNRGGSQDHGVVYEALISGGKRIYGDQDTIIAPVVPDLDRQSFREAIALFFDHLRGGQEYDYVLVDTRGGFAFESTDICALAQSFVVITEPDYTSFYQDRNLVRHISAAAQELSARPLLRSVIVNKATEGQAAPGPLNLTEMEAQFRLALTREFPLHFEDTHPVPMDIEAIQAYKTQQVPYRTAPASHFAFASLSAFSDILKVVTAAWSEDRIAKWNALVDATSQAIARRNAAIEQETKYETRQKQELVVLRRLTQDQTHQIEGLKRELERVEKGYEREIQRATQLYSPSPPQAYGGAAGLPPSSPAPAAARASSSPSPTPSSEETDTHTPLPRPQGAEPARVVSPYAVQSPLPPSPSGTTIGPPPTARERSMLRGRRTWAAALAIVILVAIGAVIGFYDVTIRPASQKKAALPVASPESQKEATPTAGSSESQRDDLLAKIYSPLPPPPLKVSYLEQLLSQNWRAFDRIDLSGTTLDRLNLQGASLRSASLSKASLRNANLAGADLSYADLTGADLEGADLRNANLEGARITARQLALAQMNDQTVLPGGKRGSGGQPLKGKAKPSMRKPSSKK